MQTAGSLHARLAPLDPEAWGVAAVPL